jgi:plastocyanin
LICDRPSLLCWLMLSLAASLPASGGCRSSRLEPPYVQPSSSAPAAESVAITPSSSFSPECVEIKPGDTVEWYTRAPTLAVDVTSTGQPVELFSPVIVAPLECGSPDRTCWRHTFEEPGCYEYTNSQAGFTAGVMVRDAYYGTLTATMGGSGARGLVCVSSRGSCPGLCCRFDGDCPPKRGDLEYECRARRCVDKTRKTPIACAQYAGIE